ncbi:DUF3253 domain-containing protein [Kovacikia minuta CCNUW1]|uniref:DUF3253 domain-containing protein n=1 Tax=Kovacikia minuta TaxID=2931930 RepID=UPI001CCA0C08|nr:DUF3253 domain-containing protein [Kovacikia minuta]UBF28135.1 DUF3253 domain-containing protein [Kovacikia minuta CCNUW1]
MERTPIRQVILAQVCDRGLEKTICPSEVARAIGGENWRSLMPEVRSVGAELVKSGDIEATQRGKVVDPLKTKGPIRFRVTEKGLGMETRDQGLGFRD